MHASAGSGCLDAGSQVPHSLALELGGSAVAGGRTIGDGVGVKNHGRRREKLGGLRGKSIELYNQHKSDRIKIETWVPTNPSNQST